MADVKILEKARTSFFQEDDLLFINQNNALRQLPANIMAEKLAGLVPEATPESAGLMTAQDRLNLNTLQEHHEGGIIPAFKLDYAGRTAAGVAADLLTYIKDLPGGATRKINLGVGNVAAFVGYWNNNDDTTVLLAGEWSALDIIGVCSDGEKIYCKLRLTNYNNNKTYESTLNASVFSPWEELAMRGELNNYLPLTGGALNGNSLTWNGNDLAGSAIVAKSLGVNGYVKYASGLIIQWGASEWVSNTQATRTITFPITFSTGSSAIATGFSIGGGIFNVTITSKTVKNMSVKIDGSAPDGSNSSCNWLAIGY